MTDIIPAEIVETPEPERPDYYLNCYSQNAKTRYEANISAWRDRLALVLVPGTRRLAAMKRLKEATKKMRVCLDRWQSMHDVDDVKREYDAALAELATMDKSE